HLYASIRSLHPISSLFSSYLSSPPRYLPSFPTRRSSDLHYYTTYVKFGIGRATYDAAQEIRSGDITRPEGVALVRRFDGEFPERSEEHTSELQSLAYLVCRLLLEKKKKNTKNTIIQPHNT